MMLLQRIFIIFVILLAGAITGACAGEPAHLADEAPVLSNSPTPSLTNTPILTATTTRPAPSPAWTATPQMRICPPLPGYSLEQLQSAVSNPFHPPRLGSDDPHQGVDFAVQQDGIAFPGETIQAIQDGLVISVLNDRFPYGNAVIVETPLLELPPEWVNEILLPTPMPTLGPHPSLTCPSIQEVTWNLSQRSLYVLYAHMLEPATVQAGEAVACGQAIGRVGQSGNALNPHVHVEVRTGPAGVHFSSLAHYDTRASAEEMSNYCTWRVSGLFQLVDPLRVLGRLP